VTPLSSLSRSRVRTAAASRAFLFLSGHRGHSDHSSSKMDLLGSIMDKMEKPPAPTTVSKERQAAKKQQEVLKKLQEAEKEKLRKFREDIQSSIRAFMAEGNTLPRLAFPPMDKTKRRIVHDVTDDMGGGKFVANSFGVEDVDRHVVVFREDTVPSEQELMDMKAAMNRGEIYDPEKAKLKRQQEEEEAKSAKKKAKVVPATNYKEKYQHLIGLEAGKSAAQVTTANAKFGYVPSENKKDQRSIEQTLADLRERKKKMREEHQEDDGQQDGEEGHSREDSNSNG